MTSTLATARASGPSHLVKNFVIERGRAGRYAEPRFLSGSGAMFGQSGYPSGIRGLGNLGPHVDVVQRLHNHARLGPVVQRMKFR
jgi:hypothetical protein